MTQPSQKSFHSQKKNEHDPEEVKLLAKILVPIAIICATSIILVWYFFGKSSPSNPLSSSQPSPNTSTLPQFSYTTPVIPAQESAVPYWENMNTDYIRFYPFRDQGGIGLGLSSGMVLMPVLFICPPPTSDGNFLYCENTQDQGTGDNLFNTYTINAAGLSYDDYFGLQIWFWQYDQNQKFLDDIITPTLNLPNFTSDGGNTCSGWVLSYEANNKGYVISSGSNGDGKGFWLIVRGDTLGRTPDYYGVINSSVDSAVKNPKYWWCLIITRSDGLSKVIDDAGLEGLTEALTPNTFQTPSPQSSQVANNMSIRIAAPFETTQDCFNPISATGGGIENWVSCANINASQIMTNACKGWVPCTENSNCSGEGQTCRGYEGNGNASVECSTLPEGRNCYCMPNPFETVTWDLCSTMGASTLPSVAGVGNVEGYSKAEPVQTKYKNVNLV